MSAVEKLKFVPPNAMTIARPFLGAEGVVQAYNGNWAAAGAWFAAAWASDMDGTVARATNSVTKFGSFADPIADGALRAEMAVAIAPHINLICAAIAVMGEAAALGANAALGQGRDGKTPIVPLAAKAGTVGHALGGGVMMYGLARGNEAAVNVGQGIIAGSSTVRGATYGNLYRNERHNTEKDYSRRQRLHRR